MSLSLELARELRALAAGPLPSAVSHETVRSVLNGVALAIGAARSPEIDHLVGAALANGAQGRTAPVPGRPERVDPLSAAIITGAATHLDDFDDTHLATVTHPTASVLAAALPVAVERAVPGGDLLVAIGLGMETAIRVADAITPWHYDAGWHITSTVGVIGAAVAAGLLRGLDEQQLAAAIGIASSSAIGHREGFGTTVKAYHPGKAAASGLLAAGLAQNGIGAADDALEGPGGFFACLSPRAEPDRVVDTLGRDWAVLDNTYKPYPCGVVSHPAIEAAERLHELLRGREVAVVRVACHPLTVELARNPEPATGLAARFSAEHGVAAALLGGPVGLPEFDDAFVREPTVAALRRRITLHPTDGLGRSAARVAVELTDGVVLTEEVMAVKGSLERPLGDPELDAKARGLVHRTLPGSGDAVIAAVRGLAAVAGPAALLAAITV